MEPKTMRDRHISFLTFFDFADDPRAEPAHGETHADKTNSDTSHSREWLLNWCDKAAKIWKSASAVMNFYAQVTEMFTLVAELDSLF